MTDDLVKRARDAHQDSSERTYKIPLIIEMADRIDALTADNARLLGLLRNLADEYANPFNESEGPSYNAARAALNTGKEPSHE